MTQKVVTDRLNSRVRYSEMFSTYVMKGSSRISSLFLNSRVRRVWTGRAPTMSFCSCSTVWLKVRPQIQPYVAVISDDMILTIFSVRILKLARTVLLLTSRIRLISLNRTVRWTWLRAACTG